VQKKAVNAGFVLVPQLLHQPLPSLEEDLQYLVIRVVNIYFPSPAYAGRNTILECG